MKKIVLSSLFSVGLIGLINSQEIAGNQNIVTGSSGYLITKNKVDDGKIDGTPYVSETFLPAKITSEATSSVEDKVLYLRYNAVNGEFEVQGVDEKVYVINKYRRDITVKFVGLNKTYQNFGYLEDGNENYSYFINLSDVDSKVKLLKKENIILIKKTVAVTSYDNEKPAHYKKVGDDYFIKINENLAQELPKKDKDIANLFPEHSKAILAHIKSEKLKTKKEEDLVKLVNYINTL
jgi:hypothetical protein